MSLSRRDILTPNPRSIACCPSGLVFDSSRRSSSNGPLLLQGSQALFSTLGDRFSSVLLLLQMDPFTPFDRALFHDFLAKGLLEDVVYALFFPRNCTS